MPELHVLRVFLGDDGSGGNPLGVFLDGHAIPVADRQAIARDLGFSETVFVEDARGAVSIHTPEQEIPLAGHPLVGTAWLLNERQAGVGVLRPPAGEVPTWTRDDVTWIRAHPEWAPGFELRELSNAAEVDAHPGATGPELLQIWAWENEDAGTVRVRVFPSALGIDEDEATGAAALLLTAQLNRPLTIRQGRGSKILTRRGPNHTVEIGGRTSLIDRRPYDLTR